MPFSIALCLNFSRVPLKCSDFPITALRFIKECGSLVPGIHQMRIQMCVHGDLLWNNVPCRGEFSHHVSSVPGISLQLHCDPDWDEALTANVRFNNIMKRAEPQMHPWPFLLQYTNNSFRGNKTAFSHYIHVIIIQFNFSWLVTASVRLNASEADFPLRSLSSTQIHFRKWLHFGILQDIFIAI